MECGACSSPLPTETAPPQIQESLGLLHLLRFLPSRRRRNLARPLESQIGHSGLRNRDGMETEWLRSAALAPLRPGVLALSSRFFANPAPTRENHDGLPTQRRGDAKTQSFSQARVRSGLLRPGSAWCGAVLLLPRSVTLEFGSSGEVLNNDLRQNGRLTLELSRACRSNDQIRGGF